MARQVPEWFRNAVIYEIYPQSFCDSNGDGIGDFEGIIGKLDYIKSLNVDAIWLNPCFDSPFQDAGYDVRDYCKTAARYGTNADLKRLFEEAKKRGIRILLDLVPGHTSVEHEWFKQAVSRAKTPYDNYYMFTDGWSSDPRGYRFISGYGERDGYYMINFFYSQPALNYGFTDPDPECKWQLPVDHPDVVRMREEMRKVMKFWLDMGCSGFRVDMAFSLVRGKEGREAGVRDLWLDYSSWMHKNYPDAVLVSEWGKPSEAFDAGFDSDFFFSWGNPHEGAIRMFRYEEYKNGSDERKPGSLRRSFFMPEGSGNSREFCDEMREYIDHAGGEIHFSLVTGNHDVPRISRNRTIDDLKVAYSAIFTLPGNPFLYYGDEIGMRYLPQVGNVEGSYSRGGARTPMQWTPGDKAGFSTADPSKFYTMIDPDPARPNVADQEGDPESLLNFTRKLIALRKQFKTLGREGSFRPVVAEVSDAPMVYERELDGERFMVALNPSKKPYTVKIALAGEPREVFGFHRVTATPAKGYTELAMDGISAAVFKLD